MISSTSVSPWQRCSVIVMRKPGQQCSPVSRTVLMPAVMITVVRGRAMRLVRRKYLGKLWNLNQTRGPVNTWQEMLSAALCQIFLIGDDDSGYHFSMRGYMMNMPAIARYESWNPMEEMASGSITS